MPITHSVLLALNVVLVSLAISPHTWAGDKSKTTILRGGQYVCVLGKKGEELRFTLNCRRHSEVPIGVSFTVIEPDSEILRRGLVPLFQKKGFSYTLRKDGLHVIALRCRGNTYDIQTDDTPMAYLASKPHRFHICGGCRKLYFFVPKSVRSFSLFLHAGTTREGASVTICNPDGKVVHQEEGDYDKPAEITIQVPTGADDRTWSVTFEDTAEGTPYLDDVVVHLSPNIRPFAVEREAWAPLFGKE